MSFGAYQNALLANQQSIATDKPTATNQATVIAHHITAHGKHDTGHAHQVDIKSKLDAIATNTANINVNVGDVEINVADLEALQTTANAELSDIHDRQDDQLGHLNTSQLKLTSLDTNFTAHKAANTAHLANIFSRQDDQLGHLNTAQLKLTSLDTNFTAHKAANTAHLANIFSRQDDQLGHANTAQLKLTSLDTNFTAHKAANTAHLANIFSRQDDQLGHANTAQLKLTSLDTNFTAHKAANTAHLANIFSRQDDILTSTNAVKTNTQSVENCVSSNKMNVNISSGIGDLATESTLQTIAEFNCDTTDTTITSCVLPSGASTAALQGTANTALAEIEGAVETLEGCVGSNKVNVNISSGNIAGFATATLQAGGLPSALSSDNLKVSLKETIDLPITNGALTELAAAINSDRVDVNIANGNISGFATATLQAGGLPSALSSDNLKVSLKETIDLPITNGALTELAAAINSDRVDVNIANGGFDGAITHSALTELASALNSDKLDVNISSGNISGFSTSANQSTANGHLLALANVVNPAIATATATTIPNKLDIIETTANAIETKTTLHTTSELKELLSGITINAGALSSEFDFENYRHARFFGISTASIGTDIIVMGSNTSGGTYYVMGENCRSETLGSTHYIYSPHIENLPRYVKIFNKSGSTNYIFTKLYVQLSEGRVAV